MEKITMSKTFRSWAEVAPRLIAVAAGREQADRVFRNCKLVNVQTREVLYGWQVAIAEGRFAYVGADASHCRLASRKCSRDENDGRNRCISAPRVLVQQLADAEAMALGTVLALATSPI